MEKRIAVRLTLAFVWIAFALVVAVAYRYLARPEWKEMIQGARELSPAQWETISENRSMNLSEIVFSRGSDQLNENAERSLLYLAAGVSASKSYVRIIGEARADGDERANERLALQRANTVAEFLITRGGLNAKRLNTTVAKPSTGDGSQAVKLVIGEPLK